MSETEVKDIYEQLNVTSGGTVMLQTQGGDNLKPKKYSFLILDLIKIKDKIFAVLKPPIDYPGLQSNSVQIYLIDYDKDNAPFIRGFSNDEVKKKIFEMYKQRKQSHQAA